MMDFTADGFEDASVEMSSPPPSVPRVMRQLRTELSRLNRVLADLTKLAQGDPVSDRDKVDIALACAATDRAYPPLEIESIAGSLKFASEGKLNKYTGFASDLVEQALSVTHSAREGIRFLDALGEPLPAQWSNLPVPILAREINRHAHTKLRGRLVGWSERQL